MRPSTKKIQIIFYKHEPHSKILSKDKKYIFWITVTVSSKTGPKIWI